MDYLKAECGRCGASVLYDRFKNLLVGHPRRDCDRLLVRKDGAQIIL